MYVFWKYPNESKKQEFAIDTAALNLDFSLIKENKIEKTTLLPEAV